MPVEVGDALLDGISLEQCQSRRCLLNTLTYDTEALGEVFNYFFVVDTGLGSVSIVRVRKGDSATIQGHDLNYSSQSACEYRHVLISFWKKLDQ